MHNIKEKVILKKIESLFDVLKSNNVKYCHWKSTNHIDATLEGLTDIDVLFASDQANLVEKLILELGFERFETVILRSYPGIHDYICLDDSGKWVHLHLHFTLNLGDRWVKAYRFPIENQILSRAQYIKEHNTFIINPNDELLLLCLRMSLKYRSPYSQKGIWEELLYIKSQCNEENPAYSDFLNYFTRLGRILEYIHSNDTLDRKKLNNLSNKIGGELGVFRRFGIVRFNYLSLKRKIYRYYVEFRRRKLSNYAVGRRSIPTGGKIIAVVGIDGSGKTSTLSNIERLFAIQMNVRKVFLGNGKSGASWYRKIIFSFYGTKAKFKDSVSSSDSDKSKSPRAKWYYALWILISLFDKEKNLKSAISAKANGSLVVSDRWPQREVEGTFDGSRINVVNPTNWIVKYVKKREQKFLLLASLVKPDLIIRLRISPEVSLIRKPGELTLDEAKQNCQLLNNIKWNNAKLVDVDADKSVEHVNMAVRNEIWSLLTDTF
jgi:thymidylate kinase